MERRVFLNGCLLLLTLGFVAYACFTSHFPAVFVEYRWWDVDRQLQTETLEFPAFAWYIFLALLNYALVTGFMFLPSAYLPFMLFLVPLISYMISPDRYYAFYLFTMALGIHVVYLTRGYWPPSSLKMALCVALNLGGHYLAADLQHPIVAYVWWGLTCLLPLVRLPGTYFIYGLATQILVALLPVIYRGDQGSAWSHWFSDWIAPYLGQAEHYISI